MQLTLLAVPAKGGEIAAGATTSTLIKTIPEDKKILTENEKLSFPNVLSLLKQSSLSSVSSFYPRFFWHTRYFSIFLPF